MSNFRITYFLVSLCLLTQCSFSWSQNSIDTSRKVYLVFDSLQMAIKQKIDSVGRISAVKGVFIKLELEHREHSLKVKPIHEFEFNYSFTIPLIVSKKEEYILKHTNRFIKIQDSLYPVFLFGVDDLFTLNWFQRTFLLRKINNHRFKKFSKQPQIVADIYSKHIF